MLDESLFKSASLCVVGNINRDIKTSPLLAGDYLFRDGETAAAGIVETIGGGGANSAFAASSLGAKVAFVGKVGADALGKRLEQALMQHGISSYLTRHLSCPTGTSINLTFQNGHRHFVSCLPNNYALAFEDVKLDAFTGFNHLLRADIWFSESMLFGGNEKLFRAARQAGLAVSIDLNWDPQWNHAAPEKIRERKEAIRSVLSLVNVAHGNICELNALADSSDLDTTLKRLADWGVESVVVHMGEKGAGYYHQGKLWIEPPAPIQSRVNTTGTGDVLSVCMMLLHAQSGIPIPERLRLANFIVAQFIENKRQIIPSLSSSW